MQNRCVVIAISGASASGKTLFTQTVYQELQASFGHHIGVITEDSYYRDQAHMSMEERMNVNYDHPDAMDHDLLVQHLQTLQNGQPVDVPTYCYTTCTRAREVTRIFPKRVLILEGILLLADQRLREKIDFGVFVDAPLDICLIRRLKRDVIQRGRTVESILSQYQATVRPMYFQFVGPSKQYADIIVPRGGKNRIAINCLKASIEQLIADSKPPIDAKQE